MTAVLALLALPVGSPGRLGAQDARAADPRGDWYAQAVITKARARNSCFAFANTKVLGFCDHIVLIKHGVHGPRSRYFTWDLVFEKAVCRATYYISNKYRIYSAKSGGCKTLYPA